MNVRFLLILLLAFSVPSIAQDKYVRQGATGNGSGSDWTNAYTSLSAAASSISRGATIWVADGTYGSVVFSTPANGTQVISVKKATSTSHGTSTGWSSAYGDGQAVVNSTVVFASPYWIFDGQKRNEADWFDGTGYGFKVAYNGQDQQIQASDHAVDNVQVRYTNLESTNASLPSQTVRRYTLDMYDPRYLNAFTGWVVSHNLFKYGNVMIFMPQSDGIVVEYNAFDDNDSNDANHGEAVSAYYGSHNAVYRYNRFRQIVGTAAIAFISNGVKIYGNQFWNCSVGDGIVGFLGQNHNNNLFYNNTIVDSGGGWNSGVAYGSGSGNVAYNNLWVNSGMVTIAGSHDYNAFSDSDTHGESHAQTGVSTSFFRNYAGDDFSLARATNSGTSLSSPYNVDMTNTIRGSDGIWDRGALEYNGTSAQNPPAPTGLQASVQ
jgi:hypothetical protein